ncbi:hypothetical protein PHYPSEUDO_000491 [Phytophthora pseudosyringae]|uniref:DUF7769 domain-containing protein n=1 Tax=Phytophthora pseudosyringae TaxID=221518 RepID=A0A8T1VY35_9STRA|nr:hypothetical protein PHYPSEUDO_000491 [Phytophthora pseudosyringae]
MPTAGRRRDMSDSGREQVILSLLQCTVEGVPRRSAVKEVAAKFRVDRRPISRGWQRAKAEEAKTGRLCADSRGHARGQLLLDLSAKLEKLSITPLDQRSTIRSASAGCGRVPLQRRVKGGQLVAPVSNIKQLLMDANKAARMAW